jgi:Bifunctional DNA primase/polymerase, N-terminal
VSAIKSLTSLSLGAALTLAEQGLPCFPCRSDKRPATPHGFKDATCDSDKLHALWKRHPGPLVGVPTGEIAGFDILDIDPRHGGERWFAEHRHRVTQTRTHKTGSGGAALAL